MSRISKIAATLPGTVDPDNLPELVPLTIRKVIRETHGDLILASTRLGVSVSKLDRALRLTKEIPRFLRELKRINILPEYAKLSLEQIENDIARRAVLYKSEALDAIHALATMPISENSAQNQVKLLAALRLYQQTHDVSMGNEIDATLRALNERYQQTAPRIKSVRERVIEFEQPPVLEG